MKKTVLALTVLLILCSVCKQDSDDHEIISDVTVEAQATSLLGEPLYASKSSEDALAKLDEAKKLYDANPGSADNLIWLGRRTAYTGNYQEAIQIYTKGIDQFPQDARFFRHRGHRYISVREFDRAIQDFEQAATLIQGKEDKIEPDGQPNVQNIPVSTLHTNIWYHLGLAYYLKHDLENALRVYYLGIDASTNDDMLVATSHWLYMTLRLLGKDEEAEQALSPIHKEMNVIENTVYHHLCLLYKGELSIEELFGEDSSETMDAALGYGIGNWYFYNGQKEEAKSIFDRILATKGWAAFGYIAAEAQVAREFSQSK